MIATRILSFVITAAEAYRILDAAAVRTGHRRQAPRSWRCPRSGRSWHADGGGGSVAISSGAGMAGRGRGSGMIGEAGAIDGRSRGSGTGSALCRRVQQQVAMAASCRRRSRFLRRNVKAVASVSEDRSCRDDPGDFGGAIHTMPIRAILFDKDGTLVDFQRTWGPATYTVLIAALQWRSRGLRAPRRGQPVRRRRSARCMPGSPVVIETTYGYGKLWAQALGRPLTPEFVDDIDRLFFQTTLDHLTPMGDVKAPARRPCGARAAARPDDQRCRRQHPRAAATPRARRAAGIRRGL